MTYLINLSFFTLCRWIFRIIEVMILELLKFLYFMFLGLGVQFSSVQLVSHVRLFATPWTTACQASLSITNSQSSPKLMSIESNQLILCCPLLLLPSIFPSIRVFSNDSALCIRWPKYWSFSFSVSPSSEYSGLIFFRIDWLISFQSKGLSKVFSNTTVWKHLFLSHLDNKHTLWTIIFQKMHLEMSWWKLSAHVNVKKNSVDSIFKSTI